MSGAPTLGTVLDGQERDAERGSVMVVRAKEPLCESVCSIQLGAVDGAPAPAWAPGAHVDLVVADGLTRQYSLCGDPADRTALRVAVLREPAGRVSAHLHDQTAVGARVLVRGPRNNFPLVDAASYLFIAGGIGITPLVPMVGAAERAGADWSLVYAGRRRTSMAFLDALGAHGDRVVVRASDDGVRLDVGQALSAAGPDTVVYCCGPERLLAAVEQAWGERDPDRLRLERFKPRAPADDAPADTSFEVVLERTGTTVTVPVGTSLLDAVNAVGADVLSSCGEGTCGTCEVEVLDGVPDHRDSLLTAAERAANDCLMTCVSRSLTPRLVLDL